MNDVMQNGGDLSRDDIRSAERLTAAYQAIRNELGDSEGSHPGSIRETPGGPNRRSSSRVRALRRGHSESDSQMGKYHQRICQEPAS